MSELKGVKNIGKNPYSNHQFMQLMPGEVILLPKRQAENLSTTFPDRFEVLDETELTNISKGFAVKAGSRFPSPELLQARAKAEADRLGATSSVTVPPWIEAAMQGSSDYQPIQDNPVKETIGEVEVKHQEVPAEEVTKEATETEPSTPAEEKPSKKSKASE